MNNEESNASQIAGVLGCGALILFSMLLGGLVWFVYHAATDPHFWQ